MNRKSIYSQYYSNIHLQKRVISKKDFTYRNLLSHVEPLIREEAKVLDIGCGTGAIDFYLASRGLHVTGIDVSKEAINAAKENSRRLGMVDKTNFYTCDFPVNGVGGIYDLVLVLDVLEHMHSDLYAIRKMKKSLAQEGFIIFSVPLLSAPLFRIGVLKNFENRVGHLRRYDINKFSDLMEKSGLQIIKMSMVEGVLRNSFYSNKFLGKFIKIIKGPLSDIFTVFDKIAVVLFGPSQLIVTAKKK